jgi:K+-sensing histidine kinase KdpD
MRPRARATQILTWIAALGGPTVLTALLAPVSASQKRDFIFFYLGLVAVLGVLRGLWPGLVAAALSFLLVDYFFVPPVGSLTIAGEQDAVNLAVCIRDQGPGVAPEVRPRLFERFVHGPSEDGSIPAVGTGLGLAIVKGLVEAHAGSVELEPSDGPEASFRFTLPVADQAA